MESNEVSHLPVQSPLLGKQRYGGLTYGVLASDSPSVCYMYLGQPLMSGDFSHRVSLAMGQSLIGSAFATMQHDRAHTISSLYIV